MFSTKLYRLLFGAVVLIYLSANLIYHSRIRGKQAYTTPAYGKIDSIESDVHRLEMSLKDLNIQQRLTAIEVQVQTIKGEVDKSVAWQDKFQWALIVLLGESVWRLYDQFKNKRS